MATRSLSPHQITQRLLKHRAAVATLALYRSMQIVKDALRRQGRKVSLVPASALVCWSIAGAGVVIVWRVF